MTKPRLDQGPDYERGFIDGMQHQMQSSVDKAVNRMAQPETPPECQTEAEKRAFAFGWFKAMEAQRLAQPEQEPVACIGTNGELMWLNKPMVIYSKPQPLYTDPPQREWVGLTDEDWDEIFGDAWTIGEAIKVTEAKLKEKNT